MVASTASSIELTTNPDSPFFITSGIDPQRNATTGVPHAIASIMTNPNGSGQSTGNRNAAALPMNSFLSCSPISPTHSTSGSANSGLISLS